MLRVFDTNWFAHNFAPKLAYNKEKRQNAL